MTTKNIDKLMGAAELLETVWSKGSRPTQDWLRVEARKYLKDNTTGIPCQKLRNRDGRAGRLLFSETEVRKRLGLNGGR